MKKFISIAFLTLYLFSTTELSELLKFPLLVEHFAEHKAENQSITLWKFLCLHYAEGSPHDADHDKDMKLPFKSYSFNSSSVSLVHLISDENCSFPILKFKTERKSTTNFYTFLVSSSHLKAIWQPPQIC